MGGGGGGGSPQGPICRTECRGKEPSYDRGRKVSWGSNHLEGEGRDVLEEEKEETNRMAKTRQRSASRSVGDRGAAGCIDVGAQGLLLGRGRVV